MTPDFIRRMSHPVPRYTSYPTAASFSGSVGPVDYAEALAQLGNRASLSLYVHIPFCSQMCWYCGCSTKAVRSRAPIAEYLDALNHEMTMVSALRTSSQPVSHLHWGGGTPNILTAGEILRLADDVRAQFKIAPNAEFGVEIDPRTFGQDQAKAFAEAGVTRASIGVQDFDPVVQTAINRVQSFEVTKACLDALRSAGIANINIDLVYGLPHQTRGGIARTVEKVLELAPDRVALFGYAHLPDRAKHQKLIDSSALPITVERFALSQRARRLLLTGGFSAIGIDHYARPDDPLVAGRVRRNFQGYTSDAADALIGVGASSISRLPTGYFQNATQRHEYLRRVANTRLATARGFLLDDEDRMRGFVIEKLMCEFAYSGAAVRAEFGTLAESVARDADILIECDAEGLIERTADGFRVTAKGMPFVRSIAACFDSYLDAGAGSSGV